MANVNTYTKLHSGQWGVRCTMPVEPGQYVTITKKNESQSVVCIDAIVWTGPDRETGATVMVCSIVEGSARRAGAAKLPEKAAEHAPDRNAKPGERCRSGDLCGHEPRCPEDQGRSNRLPRPHASTAPVAAVQTPRRPFPKRTAARRVDLSRVDIRDEHAIETRGETVTSEPDAHAFVF